MTQIDIEKLREAIAATEYKYFGDYEMSDSQRNAVDVLVEHARASLSLKADNRSSMERLGDILRGSSFKPTQKYLGAAFLGYDYARRYYAYPPAAVNALPALLSELERKTKALEEIGEICRNAGRGNAIVNERIVERCEDVAAAALKGEHHER